MKTRAMVVIVLAAVCGLSAAWGMSQIRGSTKFVKAENTVPVVVASAPVQRGTMITEDDIEIKQWPKEALCDGVLQSTDLAVKRVAMVPIVAGEPVFDKKLAAKGSARGLASLIPHGMRAYTIQASSVASNVGGFVLPGNKVDILLTLKGMSGDQTGGGSTVTLLQAVEVLAVDQQLDAPAENKVDPRQTQTVTLLVTPEQAAVLDLGQSSGVLTLSLRNPEDLNEASTRPAMLRDFRFKRKGEIASSATTAGGVLLPGDDGPVEENLPAVKILTIRGDDRREVEVDPRQQQRD